MMFRRRRARAAWTSLAGLVGECGRAFANLGFADDAKYKPLEAIAAAERDD